MYTHIVFDVDGTLVDTEEAETLALGEAFREALKKEPSAEDLRLAFGMTTENVMKKLGFPDMEDGVRLWRKHILRHADKIALFGGIRETLEQLKGRSRALGVVTSRTRAEYDRDAAVLGLSDYFPLAVCADDTKRHKPYPDPMLKFLKRSKADPGKTLYIGDTAFDWRCARDAGVDFALALWGRGEREGIGARYFLSSPGEIVGLL